jgi:hypothetical protein
MALLDSSSFLHNQFAGELNLAVIYMGDPHCCTVRSEALASSATDFLHVG